MTILKKDEDHQWLSEVTSEALQQSLRNLDSAYTAFFRKNARFPKFKAKHKSKASVKFINNVRFDFEKWRVRLPKLGWVKLCENRAWDQSCCKQGTVTVTRDKCGEHWLTVVVSDLQEPKEEVSVTRDTAIGIDLGISDFAITSDGVKYRGPKYLAKALKMLAHLQKILSRTKKGSKRHEKAKLRVAKCYRDITNKRIDFLQELSTELIRQYDTVCLEGLNVKGMEQNHHLAKAITDASWGEFVRELMYKAQWNGKNVIQIRRFEPSSKTCSGCGYIKKDLEPQ